MRIDICAGLGALVLALSNPLCAQVVLSEVMHDPHGADHHDEYIELVNISETEPVDLRGWHLGSEEELDRLVDKGTGLVLKPGQFALVLDGSYFGNSTTYETLHPDVVLLAIQDRAFGRAGWPNSREGSVILSTAGGDTVEVFHYPPAEQSGFSWEKIDLEAGAGSTNWERALVDGGTPGRLNSVYEQRRFTAEGITLKAEPNPFSQTLVLSYGLPASPALVDLWIYDIEGYPIRQLVDSSSSGPSGSVEWDGRDRQGRSVPTGLYIAHLAASAAGRLTQLKKVVVRSAP